MSDVDRFGVRRESRVIRAERHLMRWASEGPEGRVEIGLVAFFLGVALITGASMVLGYFVR